MTADPPASPQTQHHKYETRNPVALRLVDGFVSALSELVSLTGASEAHEVGCGEGELAQRLHRSGLQIRGSDLSSEIIVEARRRTRAGGLEIPFEVKALEELEPGIDSAELVLCCEVLEHVEDPVRGLDVLASLAEPWLIVSVPREPLWRVLNLARLKYVPSLGNTPGHLNHWSRQSFLRFLSSRVRVIEVRSPLPWTMALCRAEPSP